MRRALPALLLVVALAAVAKKPAAPQPPPPPVEEPAPEEAPLPPDETFEAPPEPRTDPPPTNAELSDEEAGLVAIGMLCCCSVFLIALVVLIVWLVKRGTKPAQASPFSPVAGIAPPQPAPPGGMQLSILALALEPQAREVVEQQLSQLGIAPVPNTPDARGRLVRELARALLTVQPSWRQFGYGEKPGLADLPSAESSYRTASEDFRARAFSVGATGTDSGLVVVTLLVCCRRSLLGVSRLDDPTQVRNLLEDRMRVTDGELLGAELLWAPAAPNGRISEAELGLRFPEMSPLRRAPI